ncbi:TRAP transporter substrate-binding protein [Nesterenkonia muleiensis]|uniref:TRAP transporter substrate-binding protein n=1 Tax=Nesterenkonia muleiensis TaxID=2282648 RepID=UPI0013004DFA|nr:TRAP transporter substrate-binding protein [Nesterenkonia muleiensis]
MSASILILAACGNDTETTTTSGADDEITLRYATGLQPEDTVTQGMEIFADLVDERTDGQVTIDVYHSGQLGSIQENLEQVQTQIIDMTNNTSAELESVLPSIAVMGLPYLFGTTEEVRNVLDSDVTAHIEEAMEEQGVKILSWQDQGFRHVFSNVRPITSAEDLRGQTIRLTETSMHIDAFDALAANPVPLEYTELYSALEQGVVEGFENPVVSATGNNLHEVVDYLSLTNHAHSQMLHTVNLDIWETIPEEFQTIIEDAATEAAEWVTEETEAREQEALDLAADHGVVINEIDEDKFEEMADIVRPTWDAYREQIGDELMEMVEDAIGIN